MAYTVNQLAKLAGISIRMLHHYDEIGLLKPAYYGENKYRYYEKEQLLQLQQILFFKSLGIPLSAIQEILASEDFNKIAALKSHRKILKNQLGQIKKLIKTIDKTILHLRGKAFMQTEEMYDGFDNQKHKQIEEYLIEHMGKSAKRLITASKKKRSTLTSEELNNLRQETDLMCQEFKRLLNNNINPESIEVQRLIKQHYDRAKRISNLTVEEFVKLNELDIAHPEMRKQYDTIHPKFAGFFIKAIHFFAKSKS